MDLEFRTAIKLGNDAMATPGDLARALRKIADRIDAIGTIEINGARVHDDNGNTVGHWAIVPTEAAPRAWDTKTR